MEANVNFERRIYACKTCHRALKVCPDCGQPLGFEHPVTKIFCRRCDCEAVELPVEQWRTRPGEIMGLEGHYQMPTYECPACHNKCCPSDGKIEDVHTGVPDNGTKVTYEVVARDGSRYRNIGFYIDSGT